MAKIPTTPLSKLLEYQIPHTIRLLECLLKRNRVLDASDTGTGKTYCAIAAAKMLGFKPFIICPKSVITSWAEVCKIFEIDYLGISNYEMLKNCRYYTPNSEPVACPYMDRVMQKTVDKKTKKEKEEAVYQFYLPADTLVIFDEAHRCKNSNTETSKLLIALSRVNLKIMLLSATISDKINCFKPFGVILGFYQELTGYKSWMLAKKKAMDNQALRYKYTKKYNLENSPEEEDDGDITKPDPDQMAVQIIHQAVFPAVGSRMKISELGDLFPSNTISANSYNLASSDEVDAVYREINLILEQLKKLHDVSQALARLIRARQKAEMLKVPLFLELALEALESGYSVVIFVNYVDTLENLHKDLTKYNPQVIRGGQSLEDRDANIQAFQSNRSKVIIAMCQAGNVGISLHDKHGGHPRMSIISPTWSGQDMKQVLGRIHRAGSKSPAIQKIVYVAKTYEEEICALIKNKLKNIDGINDCDLTGPKIPKQELEEIFGTESVISGQEINYEPRQLTEPNLANPIVQVGLGPTIVLDDEPDLDALTVQMNNLTHTDISGSVSEKIGEVKQLGEPRKKKRTVRYKKISDTNL